MVTPSSFREKVKPKEWEIMGERITLSTLDLSNKNLTQLPEQIFEMHQLEALDLSGNKNINISNELSKLTNLKVLCLDKCNLDTVPAAVMNLPQLEALSLTNNKNIILPDEMLGLVNLTALALVYCNLDTIPPVVLELPNLKELDISYNTKISIPNEVYKLNNVKVLRLRYCNLVTVPPAVLKLTQLEELDLSWNRRIHLPNELSGLTNIRVLKLEGTGMDKVPPVVWRLTQLEWLDLRSNPLQTLPADIKQITNVKHLDLSNCELRTLPPEVGRLTQLEWLNLNYNPLQTLPMGIEHLTKVKHLDLSKCKLHTLPPVVGILCQLEWLSLSCNPLQMLPKEIGQLDNVKHLDLSGCQLRTLPPEVGRLAQIEWLDLRSNILPALPAEIGQLTNIRHLNLSDCELHTLPPEFGRLTQLEWLVLSWNKLHTLPAGIGQLTNVKHLDLSRCQLRTLLPESALWRLTQLEWLNLSFNPLQTLPAEIDQLTNVKHLDLSYCQLRTLPTESALWRLTQLEWLGLSFNLLQTLPAGIGKLTNVKHLDLSWCDLNTLPSEVGSLTQLERLDLHSNTLKMLPAEIKQLTNIKRLDLSRCSLRTLPPEVVRLTHLELLNLSSNPLQTLPAEIGQLTDAKHLDLSYCKLHTLPPEVGRLTQLEWLNLSYNPLQTLPAEFGQLTNIEDVDLSCCHLRTLPHELGRLILLERLDLSYNLLEALPSEFGKLNSLSYIDVSHNGLITPPVHVCTEGIAAIRQYFDELERSEEQVSAHLKVVVLGENMAGKTSLIQTLSTDQSTLTEEEDRTHCVEMTQWAPGDDITFEVYDLGGYDVYHLTHQFFLTQGALNLLTVNLHEYRCTEQSYTEAVGFWLDTLNARVPGAVVTIVGSKKDLCSDTEIEKKSRDIQERFTRQHDTWERTIQQQIQKLELEMASNTGTNQRELEQHFERTRQLLARPLRLTGVYCVSSAEPTSRLDILKSHMIETANDTKLFPTLRRILPQTWVKFEQRLRDLRERPTVGSYLGYRSSTPSSHTSSYHDSGYTTWSSTVTTDSSYRFSTLGTHRSTDSGYTTWSSTVSTDSGYRFSTLSSRTSTYSSGRASALTSHTSTDSGDRSSALSSNKSSGSSNRSSIPSSHHSLKWLTETDCLRLGQLAGLSSDRLEPVLSYLQQVGTILRYKDIPQLKDFIFYDPSGLTDVMKELFHHDLMKVFTNKNPRLKSFSNTYLKKIRKNLSSRGFLPKQVAIALLGPHAIPVRNVDVITELMEHFGLLYTEWSDEQDEDTRTPVGYYIPWYIQKERPKSVKRSVQKRQKKGFTLTCEITGFCPPGLFERLSVVVNKLINSRQDWKDVIIAVSNTSSLPVIVRRETKDDHGSNIIVNVTVPAQAVQGTQVVWDIIGPLKDKLSTLLKEWPGLLYRLVYSKLTQQAKQKGDSQTLSVSSSIIPTFEVGPRGCTVQHGGVTLEFPEGCVRDARFISVEVEAVPVTEDVRTNLTAMSAVLTVEQDFPQRFLRPVTVRLPWVWTQSGQKGEDTTERTKTVVLHYSREDGWTVFPIDVQEGPETVVFQTDRFKSYVVTKVKDVCTEIMQLWGYIWNGYCEDKVYLIVMPNRVFLPERLVNLLCVHKQDDVSEFFNIGYVSPNHQVKQRISMSNKEKIRASLHKGFDLRIDPRDIPRDGLTFEFPDPPADCNRYSVAVEKKEGVPEKDIYEGRISYERLDLTGNARDVAARLKIANLPVELHKESQGVKPGTIAPEDVVSQHPNTGLRQRSPLRHQQQAWPAEHPQQPARQEQTSPPRQQRHKPNIPFTAAMMIAAVAMIVYLFLSADYINNPFRLPGGGKDATQNDNSTQGMDLRLVLAVLAVLFVIIYGICVFRKGPKAPIILLLNDEYGTSKGGTSTINCQVGQTLKGKAAVYCTVLQLNVPKEDQEAAERDSVKLIQPDRLGHKTEPTLDWLTYYHSVHFPNLPQDITCIIGHADITDTAARNIKDQRYPEADLITFTHVLPEDTDYYKGGRKAMKAWKKEKDMVDKVDNAKVAFSVGKRIYGHFSTKYKGDKKPRSHEIFLPKPSEMFLNTNVRPGGEQKVVLSIGRVRKVEKLKGHDLAGRSLRDVVKRVTNVRWCVRGISEDDHETSKKILEDNLNSPDLIPTLRSYGTQADIRDDMMTAHLVLMPSRSEPFGLVGLEAIAAGIPVLISDKTGLAEMILDLIQQGKLHPDRRHVIVETSVGDSDPVGDAKRWADKIVDILEHSDSEFEKAARFKQELVESKYWEDSHRTLLRACGIPAGAGDQ